jgi:signal transduction histidine kinase
VTIRRLLLAAFVLVGLLPASVVTLLAFERSRGALLAEIEQGVRRSAVAVSAQVDRMLTERLLNATTWNHLEVMQDLRIDDVDKRLSVFLAEVKHRYGTAYLDLLAVDTQGRIVSSSTAGRIGQRYPADDPWLALDLPGGKVRLDRIADGRLRIRTRIESSFTDGPLGDLILEYDWRQIEQALDDAADTTRQVLIVDAQDHAVGASSRLRLAGAVPQADAAGWRPADPSAIAERRGGSWLPIDLLIGSARSQPAPPYPALGWTTLLLQSRSEALAPVRHMALTFAGLLAGTVFITVLVASAVAGRIARPILALTDFTRRYLQPGPPPTAPQPGPGEIGELNRSFVRMVEDLHRSQATLAQASKLAALGEITALMAHEVRTPLGILRSSAQMLRLEPQLSTEGSELVDIIESETQRLNRLVGSMLDSARTRAPQLRQDDAHAIIEHAARLVAAQTRDRQVTLTLALNAANPWLECDGEQITQVLLNLVMNASQILPAGGHIRITTHNDDERLIVDVDDDGPGVPVEDRRRLFEPFVYKREGGIGLGLAVVRQILRQHGGEISIDTSDLGGARFRFWLPQTVTPQPRVTT